MRHKSRRTVRFNLLWALLGTLMAACVSEPTPSAENFDPPIYKLLATVYASPTPGSADREATRMAARPVVTVEMRTPTPQPTVYIGIFLGEVGTGGEGDAPIVDPARYQGTLVVAVPTVNAPNCAIPADTMFGFAWGGDPAVRDSIGCAGEPVTPYSGTTQVFERGVMYFLANGEIYALATAGAASGRYWYVAQAPAEETFTLPVPPEGLRAPSQGFGAVWRANAEIRDSLGFARTDEQPISLALQRFERGALLMDSTAGQVFVLVGTGAGGTVFGPY